MQRVLEMMGEALLATWQAAWPALQAVPTWAWIAVAALLAALVVVRTVRIVTGAGATRPELYLARAELVQDGAANGTFGLLAAFSNLHHEPVQLLALAAVGGDGQRTVVEATALIAPRKAVELEADLDLGGGGRGRLELFLYVPSSRARAWRVRVPLAWEPWAQRYRALPLEQTLAPVRALPKRSPRAARPPGEGADPYGASVRAKGSDGFPDAF